MSEEDVVFSEDEIVEGPGADTGERGGFLPELVVKILKIVAMALAAIIFIVTVVVITVNILGQGTANQSYPAISPEYEGQPDILAWYDGIVEIRTRTADSTPMTIIVKIKLGYEMNDKDLQTELIQRTAPFQAKIRTYFGSKTAEELTSRHEPEIRKEIKEALNKDLSSGALKDVIIMSLQVLDF